MDESNDQPERILWYFADPMCSWCWGFAPVVREIKRQYGAHFPIALICGGLRPYTEAPISAEQRADILHHWHNVQEMTGQAFAFSNAMPEGFVYDTEPPSRAVITIGNLDPAGILAYLESVQYAFYVEQLDVTKTDVLADLAQERGVDTQQFREYFESDDAHKMVRAHFTRSRQAGIRGFPTVVMQKGESIKVLTSGYQPYPELAPKIDDWLL